MLPTEPGAGRLNSSAESELHAAISLFLAQALWRNASITNSFIALPLLLFLCLANAAHYPLPGQQDYSQLTACSLAKYG